MQCFDNKGWDSLYCLPNKFCYNLGCNIWKFTVFWHRYILPQVYRNLKHALVIARCLLHCDIISFYIHKYYVHYTSTLSIIYILSSEFSMFCYLYHEPWGERNNSKILKAREIFSIFVWCHRAITGLSLWHNEFSKS